MKNAIIIRPDGGVVNVQPKNGTDFKLKELYELIQTNIVQVTALSDGRAMWMDEEVKIRGGQIFNSQATKLARAAGIAPDDCIYGIVLVCDADMVL